MLWDEVHELQHAVDPWPRRNFEQVRSTQRFSRMRFEKSCAAGVVLTEGTFLPVLRCRSNPRYLTLEQEDTEVRQSLTSGCVLQRLLEMRRRCHGHLQKDRARLLIKSFIYFLNLKFIVCMLNFGGAQTSVSSSYVTCNVNFVKVSSIS